MTRRIGGWFFRAAIALVALTVLVYYASPLELPRAVERVDASCLWPLPPLVLAGAWLAGLQLKVLTDCHGMNVSLQRIIGINFAADFYNIFSPGILAGGGLRWYRLTRDNRMHAHALAAIAMNRLVSIYFLVLLGVIGWLVEGPGLRSVAAGFVLASALVSLSALALFSLRRGRRAGLRSRDSARGASDSRVRALLRRLVDAFAEYRQLPSRDQSSVAFLALAGHAVATATIAVLCVAMGLAIPVAALLWIIAIIHLAALLPLTVAGIGVREGGWIFFLQLYGVAPAEALVLSVLTFLIQLLRAAIGMLLELALLFRKRPAEVR